MQRFTKAVGELFSITFPFLTYFTEIMPLLQFLGLIISIVVGVTIIKMNVTKTSLYEKQLERERKAIRRKAVNPDNDE